MADFYELQRAMRAMRQAALQRGALAILDLGSSKIGPGNHFSDISFKFHFPQVYDVYTQIFP